jgi:S-adenosylmethionine:tRNA ribosyltransferase-isomerase
MPIFENRSRMVCRLAETMDVSLFDYQLPPERIAQFPLDRRDRSRLLQVTAGSREFRDGFFYQLPELLRRGDLLVLNDTRVIPARLLGRKPSGGRVEAFLVRPATPAERAECGRPGEAGEELWQALFKAAKPVRPGLAIEFGSGLKGEVVAPSGLKPGFLLLKNCRDTTVAEAIEELGRVPLPPYIRRDPEESDRTTYQTVFAARNGAVAAPTAGLHFTPEVLEQLEQKGIRKAFLTLHVGLGTFAPVRCEKVEEHRIHEEFFSIPPATLELVDETRKAGGRIVAVGTTVTRSLEYFAATGRSEGMCDLFIYPGFEFRLVDVLLTNFHLPASTLMMLVSAFAGRETIMAAYRRALELEYRFYSYGDAMLISRTPE